MHSPTTTTLPVGREPHLRLNTDTDTSNAADTATLPQPQPPREQQVKQSSGLRRFFSGYISKKGLENLKHYKYSSHDGSYIAAYIMQPWWRAFADQLPVWMAPNMVTLIGFFFAFVMYGLVPARTPSLTERVEPWAYVAAGFCFFVYQTMDAADGKQARVTGTSSPLGELFDHGCDSITNILVAITLVATIQMGASWMTLIACMHLFVPFFLAQWEEYHTGSLKLGIVNAPTEGILIMCSILVYTGIDETNFWMQPAITPYTTEISEFLGFTWQNNHNMCLVLMLGAIPSAFSNAVGVYKAIKYGEGEPAMKANPLVHLVPIFSVLLFGCLWAYYSPSDVLRTQPRVFLGLLGLLSSNLVSKITVARVCREPFYAFQTLLVPLPFAVLNAFSASAGGTPVVNESALLNVYCVLAGLGYLHFALSVINDMCDHLGIRCLTIPKDKWRKKDRKE